MKNSRINPFAAVAILALGVALGGQHARAADYAGYIAGTSPVGWWGMNETGVTATTADLSGAYGAANNQAGANINLTYQGAGVNTVADQAGYVTGAGNRAAYFDGTTDSGLYGHGAVPYDTNVAGAIYRYPSGFSGEFWIQPQLIGGGLDAQRVIATREFGFGFEDTSTAHRLQFTTFGKQDYFSSATVNLFDGGWHQIGFSFDGNMTTNFFVDGVAVGSQVGTSAGIRTAADPGANTINLGHRNTNLQHYKGGLDEAVLWDTTRSESDFAASFAAATVPESSTLAMLGLGMLCCARRKR